MNSDTDNPAGQPGLPFTGPVVRQIVEELFHKQIQWKTSDLFEQVIHLHQERGGIVSPNPEHMVKRVVKNLKEDGLVSAPGHGWWRWTGSSTTSRPNLEVQEANTTADVEDGFDEFQSTIGPDKEIGIGTECVYLYFNSNDRRLAEHEGRNVWECKIGHTTSTDAIYRILSQGVRTALSRLPTVGLVIRTDDSAALERILHSSLRLIEAEVPDSPGTEWFMTSPARVEAWYVSFQNALATLRGD